MGTADAETVQLQIDGNGDLQLRDETNAIIPIDNHPDGPGFETDPLDPSAITSGEIYFDMGGNNDRLDLALPSGLDVTVQESDGDDNTVLRFADDRLPGTINVDSEQIEIDSGSAMVSAVDANLNLSGDVSFGTDGQSTELKLGSGSLEVTGRLILSGDATISGAGASVDLSTATITADSSQATFAVDLQNQSDSDLKLGGSNDSAGSFVEVIDIRSAHSVSLLNSPLFVAGDFSIANTNTIQMDADVDTTADSADGNIDLRAVSGITLASDSTLSVGDGVIVMDGGGGPVDLLDARLQSNNSGDAITILNAGDVMLGEVTASSGA